MPRDYGPRADYFFQPAKPAGRKYCVRGSSPTKYVDNFVKKWLVKHYQAAPVVACDRLMTNEAVKNTMKSMSCNMSPRDRRGVSALQIVAAVVEHFPLTGSSQVLR
jgi:hypothetical protein